MDNKKLQKKSRRKHRRVVTDWKSMSYFIEHHILSMLREDLQNLEKLEYSDEEHLIRLKESILRCEKCLKNVKYKRHH